MSSWLLNTTQTLLLGIASSLIAAYIYSRYHARPSIRITRLPRFGTGHDPNEKDTISGTVSGVKAKNVKVLIYTYSDQWYIQPREDLPFTPITTNRRWIERICLGGKYAAFLVRRDYKPPIHELPHVGGPVLASDIRPR